MAQMPCCSSCAIGIRSRVRHLRRVKAFTGHRNGQAKRDAPFLSASALWLELPSRHLVELVSGEVKALKDHDAC